MSKLYASAVKRRITPPAQLIALWNKSAAKRFSAPLNDIYVQAMVFSNKEGQTLVHIGGDIIMTIGPALTDKISTELKISPSCVFSSCTHNHMIPGLTTGDGGAPPPAPLPAAAGATGAAPAGGGGFGVGEGAKEWTDLVLNQTMDAVREAMATLRPARLGAGHGVSGISVNREWDTPVGSLGTGDRNGETIHEVSVLRVDEVGGKPIAVLINSNCHAGSFYGGNVGLDHRLTGGDVAGLVSEFVGNAIGNGVVPIWAIGGAGDQNTYFHSGMMWPSIDEKGEFYKEVYVMKDDDAIKLARNTAAIQCMEVLNVYKNITEFSENFDLKTGVGYKTVSRRKQTRPGLASAAPQPIQYEEATFRFYLIALNGIAFAGANTESFIGLKKAVRGILPYDEKFWIDMNFDKKAGHAGYVPSPRYDSNYDAGQRNSLQGNLLPYNGNDVLRAFSDGFDELVKTIA